MRFALYLAAASLLATPAAALAETVRINGQTTLNDGRIFALSARLDTDTGEASGRATLISRDTENGGQPFRSVIDISCAKDLGDGTYALSGLVTNTNDPVLLDSVYFIVSEDGSISRAYYFDDDPETVGDPALCQGNVAGDFPLEEPIRGGVNIRD